MTDEDRAQFTLYLAGLAEVFDVVLTEMRVALYFEVLKDLDIEDVHEACNVATRTLRFFPKPAELREALSGSAADRCAVAWDQVMAAVRRYGGWKSVAFADRAIMAAVERLGGWEKFCTTPEGELQWLQRDFMQLYRVLDARGLSDAPDRLVGLTEASNRLHGYQEHVGQPVVIQAAQVFRAGALNRMGAAISARSGGSSSAGEGGEA